MSRRYARANNPYLKPELYVSSKPNVYLLYVNANNLYGWAMSQNIAGRTFKFLTPYEIEKIDICSVSDDSNVGYVIDCDFHCPDNLHDRHNGYPLAPESIVCTKDVLSPFARSFMNTHVECKKLIPNLNNKVRYVKQYRNLKLCVELGLQVTKIHHVLSFEQKAWMKPFIAFNTRKWKEAKSVFLCNHSIKQLMSLPLEKLRTM